MRRTTEFEFSNHPDKNTNVILDQQKIIDNQVSTERLIDYDLDYNKQQNNKRYQEDLGGIGNRSTKSNNKKQNQFQAKAKRFTLLDVPKQKPREKRLSFNLDNRDLKSLDQLTTQQTIKRNHQIQLPKILKKISQQKDEFSSSKNYFSLKSRKLFNNSVINFNEQEIIQSHDEPLQTKDKNKINKQNNKQNGTNQQQSNHSSENIFEVMRKREQQRRRSAPFSDDAEEENIFQKYKKIQKQNGEEQQSSDSEQENIFEKINKKQEAKINLYNSFHGYTYPLENILEASNIYKDYLTAKKPGLAIPQLQQTIISNISKRFFFKPKRIEFKRLSAQLPVQSIQNSSNFLCKINKNRDIFYFQDLKEQQPRNLNGIKCSKLLFQQKDKIGKNIQHDHINQRFYFFSNKQQKLLIYSSSSFEFLCKVSIKKAVFDPNLHFYHINNRCFLMIIGGYVKIQKSRVTGSNYIQIFELNKWQVILKSKLIKLIVGRINPIILSNQTNMIILGGNSIAGIDKQGKLNYNYQKNINQSTNMTGIIISTQEISQLFDYEEQVNVQNISVKIINPHILHSGIVVAYQNSFLLILPHAKNLLYIKLFYKSIIIIETNKIMDFQSNSIKNQYQKRELTLKVDRDSLIIYRINSEGILRLIPYQQKKKQLCCNIY